jgi:hypothetical protein
MTGGDECVARVLRPGELIDGCIRKQVIMVLDIFDDTVYICRRLHSID